jgi:hypothetical protein
MTTPSHHQSESENRSSKNRYLKPDTRYGARETECVIQDVRSRTASRFPHPASRITHPASRKSLDALSSNDSARRCRMALGAAKRANDGVHLLFSAAFYVDAISRALKDPAESVARRLCYFPRYKRWRRCGTAHLRLTAARRGLHRARLKAIKPLGSDVAAPLHAQHTYEHQNYE